MGDRCTSAEVRDAIRFTLNGCDNALSTKDITARTGMWCGDVYPALCVLERRGEIERCPELMARRASTLVYWRLRLADEALNQEFAAVLAELEEVRRG